MIICASYEKFRRMCFGEEEADKMMKSIMEALEKEDKDALKELFSDYALENAETLDENIDELINFFPGCEDGYKGNVSTHRTSDYGEITNVIMSQNIQSPTVMILMSCI